MWLAEGCHWHLLPRINLPTACFAWAKDATAACFDGGMNILILHAHVHMYSSLGYIRAVLRITDYYADTVNGLTSITRLGVLKM